MDLMDRIDEAIKRQQELEDLYWDRMACEEDECAWQRRLRDLGNRLDHFARTGNDRAFSALGPWRTR